MFLLLSRVSLNFDAGLPDPETSGRAGKSEFSAIVGSDNNVVIETRSGDCVAYGVAGVICFHYGEWWVLGHLVNFSKPCVTLGRR